MFSTLRRSRVQVVKVRCATCSLAALIVAVLCLAPLAGPAAAEESPPPSSRAPSARANSRSPCRAASRSTRKAATSTSPTPAHGRIAEYRPEGGIPHVFATLAEPTFLALDNSPGGRGPLRRSNGAQRRSPSWTPPARRSRAGAARAHGRLRRNRRHRRRRLGQPLRAHRRSAPELHELASSGSAQSNECDPVPYTSSDSAERPRTGSPSTPKDTCITCDPGLLFGPQPFLNGVKQDHLRLRRAPHGTMGHSPMRADEFDGVAVDESDNSVFLAQGQLTTRISRPRAQLLRAEEELIGPLRPSTGEETPLNTPPSSRSATPTNRLRRRPPQQWVAIFEPEAVEPPDHPLRRTGRDNEITGSSAHFKAEINPIGYGTIYSFHCIPGCSGTGMTANPPRRHRLRNGRSDRRRPHTRCTEYLVYITAEATTPAGHPGPPNQGGLPFSTAADPAHDRSGVRLRSHRDRSHARRDGQPRRDHRRLPGPVRDRGAVRSL